MSATAPPLVRAAAWITVVALGFTSVVAVTGVASTMVERLPDTIYVLELVATLLTGVTAVIAAATLTVPGRSYRWTLLPLPSVIVWFGCAAVRCYQHVAVFGIGALSPFESTNCFVFIAMVSMPLAIGLFFFLRRAAPINLGRVTALGGLGVAALAATLLQFFHPEDTTPVDFATHLAAVSAIVLFMMTFGRGALQRS